MGVGAEEGVCFAFGFLGDRARPYCNASTTPMFGGIRLPFVMVA